MICNRCGKAAVHEFDGHYMCLSCAAYLQDLLNRHPEDVGRNIPQMSDGTLDGTGRVEPRNRDQPRRKSATILRMPRPVIGVNASEPTKSHVNTGTTHSIDVRIAQLRSEGHHELSNAIHNLKQVIVASGELSPDEQSEALTAVEAIAKEARKAENERLLGLIRISLTALDSTTAKSADLLRIWNAARPVIAPYFGIDPL
jgi:hypothetical protein